MAFRFADYPENGRPRTLSRAWQTESMRSREVETGHFMLDFATHVLRSSASLLLANLEVNSGSERRTISEVVAAARFGRSVAQSLGCCGYTIGSIFLYRIFAKSAVSGSYQRGLKCELKSIFWAMACQFENIKLSARQYQFFAFPGAFACHWVQPMPSGKSTVTAQFI